MSPLNKITTRAPKNMSKEDTKKKTVTLLERLGELQNLLFAESKHSLLVVIQGMDASGKDGLIRNVMGSMNPQGVTVCSFKAPSNEEMNHDFLWRVHRQAPARGMIQVFNRSHYEDILITRVHRWIDDETAMRRMAAINHFEQLLVDHGHTHILKFFLHISPEEQQQRLTERLNDPAKQWKYNENDFKEAKLWPTYMSMYEDCFKNCSNPEWHIVPSDQNWYKEYIVADLMVKKLESLKMKYPGLKK
jgi:PPK2 family polyphosphate:nucleotide phosphotransferase